MTVSLSKLEPEVPSSDMASAAAEGANLVGGELEVVHRSSLAAEYVRAFYAPSQSQLSNRSLTRAARKRLIVVAADPHQPLTAMLDEAGAERFAGVEGRRVLQALVGGLLAIASFPFALGGGLIAATSGGSQHEVALNALLIAVNTGVLLGGNAWRAARAGGRDDREIERLAKERFTNWVRERYGISVNPAELGASFAFELAHTRVAKVCRKFKAADGAAYILVGEKNQLHVERHVPKVKKRKAKAKALKASGEVLEPLLRGSQFSSEAAMLIGQIGELEGKLQGLDLGVEQQHIVKRVREDVLGLAQLNARLHRLDGPSAEDQAHFATTLLTLRGELEGVVSQQHSLLSEEIEVTARYVKERRGAARSGLELER